MWATNYNPGMLLALCCATQVHPGTAPVPREQPKVLDIICGTNNNSLFVPLLGQVSFGVWVATV